MLAKSAGKHSEFFWPVGQLRSGFFEQSLELILQCFLLLNFVQGVFITQYKLFQGRREKFFCKGICHGVPHCFKIHNFSLILIFETKFWIWTFALNRSVFMYLLNRIWIFAPKYCENRRKFGNISQCVGGGGRRLYKHNKVFFTFSCFKSSQKFVFSENFIFQKFLDFTSHILLSFFYVWNHSSNNLIFF